MGVVDGGDGSQRRCVMAVATCFTGGGMGFLGFESCGFGFRWAKVVLEETEEIRKRENGEGRERGSTRWVW